MAVRRDIYRDNAFGVLALPFGASSAEIRQRAQQRLIELDLAQAPRSEHESVRHALSLLEDPRRRLEEEIYRLHCIPDPIPQNFTGIPTSHKPEVLTALHTSFEAGSSEALHDLALLRLAWAEDARSNGSLWQSAFDTWHALGTDEPYWLGVRMRAEFMDDPRVTASLVAELRQTFLNSALERFGQVVRDLIAEEQDNDAIRIYKVAVASPFGEGASAALSGALAMLGGQLTNELASHDIATISESGLVELWHGQAQRVVHLAQRCRSWLQQDRELAKPLDQSAFWLRALSVRLHNELRKTDLAADIAAKAATLAASEEVIANLAQAAEQLKFLLSRDRAVRAAESGQWRDALAHAKVAVALAPNDQRAQLSSFISTCELRLQAAQQSQRPNRESGPQTAAGARNSAWRLLWGVAAIVVGIIILINLNSGTSRHAGATEPGASVGTAPTPNTCRSERTELRSQIDDLDTQIATSRSWIASEDAWITSEKARLDAYSREIDTTNAKIVAGDLYWRDGGTAFQNYINVYNEQVASYNQRLATYRSRVADARSLSDRRSSVVSRYNGLSC